MSHALSESRKKQIDASFENLRDFFEHLAKPISSGTILLDVGCGDGYFDLKVAEVFKPEKIILTDIEDSLAVQLPPNAEFHRVDVCSDDFLKRFQNRVQVVICIATLHEIPDVFRAITNLVTVLPKDGVAFILDRTREGWLRQCEICKEEGADSIRHFKQDIDRATRLGLNSNKGIRQFWEEGFFPKVPGATQLFFNGDLYTVLYIAKQWGEVKPIPPELESQLRKLGYIK